MQGHPILADIPEGARATYQRLLELDPRDAPTLRRSIDLYVQTIDQVAAENPVVNQALGHAIARSCRAFLDLLPGTTPADRRAVIAAVEYFLLPRDGDDDLASEDGLDDDALVVSAVARRLGRDDLVVPITR